jgi:hypothetical protein
MESESVLRTTPNEFDVQTSRPLLHDQMGGTSEITSRVNVPESLSTQSRVFNMRDSEALDLARQIQRIVGPRSG